MNESEIKQLAHDFLCQNIELEICNEIPDVLYEFNSKDELLFGFRLFGHIGIGASEYISVSRTTGTVKYRGFVGQ